MSTDTQAVIRHTKNWIEEIVLGLNLCPFATQVFNENLIDYIVVDENIVNKAESEQQPPLPAHQKNDLQEQTLLKLAMRKLADCFATLDKNPDIETSLLIFSTTYGNFEDYLELLNLANLLLEDLDYSGIYQLASFHPDYQFNESTEDDASNFSNRSPYPMLHVLRESSIEKATAAYNDIEAVPENNIDNLKQIGYEKMLQKLNHCRK